VGLGDAVPAGSGLGLHAREPLTLWAGKRFWLGMRQFHTIEPTQDTCEIRLAPIYAMEVFVRDADSGASLAAWHELSYRGPVARFPARLYQAYQGVLDPQGHRTEHNIEYYWRGTQDSSSPLQVELGLECLGYEGTTKELVILPGAVQEFDIRMKRQEQVFREIRLHAGFESGAPYSGPLQLMCDGGLGKPVFVNMQFTDGTAEESLSLPLGRFTILPQGGMHDAARYWWAPAGISQRIEVVDDPGPMQVELTLRGGGVSIQAVNINGSQFRGFYLGVACEGAMRSGRLAFWDMLVLARDTNAGPVPVVWLPPGEAHVMVEMPGVGVGRQKIQVAADGTTRDLRVVLRSNHGGR